MKKILWVASVLALVGSAAYATSNRYGIFDTINPSSGNTTTTFPQNLTVSGTFSGTVPAADISGTLSTGNGGTGLTSFSETGNTTKFATSTGSLTSGDCAKWDSSGNIVDSGSACGSGGGSGTVTSVALTAPSYLTVSGSPITTSGTLALTGTSETANFFLAAPNGSSGAMTPRAIVSADIPTLNQNTTGTAANITGSSNTTLTSLSNLVTVGTIGTGTWAGTTVAVNHGGTGATTFTSNLPLIGAGTSAVSTGTVSGNTTVFATTSGTLTSGDCLKADANGNVVTTGSACGSGGGGVTSVAMPAQWGGSPITTSGTFTNPAPTTTAKTTNYSITTSDYEIRANCSSACTITMPAPGSAGAHYRLSNYATSTYALVTIAAHSSETFCAQAYTSVHMSTPGEYWEFIDDGTNWSCAEHHTQTTDISYTLSPIGSTTNPTLGTTTTNQAYWSRNGNKMTINYNLVQTGAGSGGSGQWQFPIFTGTSSDFAINTTAYPASANDSTGVAAVGAASTVGSGTFFGSCQTTKGFVVGVATSTAFKFFILHDDNYFDSSYCAWTSTIMAISFSATVPITNWEP